MSAVRSRDTKPERTLRKALHAAGLRFRVCVNHLPGRPDIYFPKIGLAVFVDGDFWHGNSWRARGFKSLASQFQAARNTEFWSRKITNNIARDRHVDAELGALGLRSLRLWESEVLTDLGACLRRIKAATAHAGERRDRLTSIEAFSGVGGLALGMAGGGFEHLAIIEWDKHACATIRSNRDRMPLVSLWPVFETDIRDFDFKPYADRITMLAAGVPCQPFSLGGKHRGDRDNRNMFPELLRAVREIRPKLVVVENVKGLLRQSFREYFDYVLLQLRLPEVRLKPEESWREHKARLERESSTGRFADLSYEVNFQLVNCANFGVPQLRERVFVVAVRSDLAVEWQPLVPTHTEAALLYAQWVDRSYWHEHQMKAPEVPARLKKLIHTMEVDALPPTTPRWRTVRDALRGLPPPANYQASLQVANHIGNPGARAYPGHTGSPYDWPAKTLKAGVHGVPGGENMLRYPNGRVRYFTAREAARIQTFPDDYIISGAWGECMRQIGNAVPVRVAQVIAERAYKLIEVAESKLANSRLEMVVSHRPTAG